MNDHNEVVKLLLENGANVNNQHQSGWTALMYAANEGHREVVRLLLKCGANQHITNTFGGEAWRLAKDIRIQIAILKKYINKVAVGDESSSCDKTVTN